MSHKDPFNQVITLQDAGREEQWGGGWCVANEPKVGALDYFVYMPFVDHIMYKTPVPVFITTIT